MLTLSGNPLLSFRADGAIFKTVALPVETRSHRGGQHGFFVTNKPGLQEASGASQPLPSEPQVPELPNDDFPFSALIWLVRQMRE